MALHALAVKELLPDAKTRLHAPPFMDVGLRGFPLRLTSSKNPLPQLPGAEKSLCHSFWYPASLAAQMKSNKTLHPGHRGIWAAFTTLWASWWIFHSSLEGTCHRWRVCHWSPVNQRWRAEHAARELPCLEWGEGSTRSYKVFLRLSIREKEDD